MESLINIFKMWFTYLRSPVPPTNLQHIHQLPKKTVTVTINFPQFLPVTQWHTYTYTTLLKTHRKKNGPPNGPFESYSFDVDTRTLSRGRSAVGNVFTRRFAWFFARPVPKARQRWKSDVPLERHLSKRCGRWTVENLPDILSDPIYRLLPTVSTIARARVNSGDSKIGFCFVMHFDDGERNLIS